MPWVCVRIDSSRLSKALRVLVHPHQRLESAVTWRAGKWVSLALSRHAGVRTDGRMEGQIIRRECLQLRGGVDGRGAEGRDYIRPEAVVGHKNESNESCKLKDAKFYNRKRKNKNQLSVLDC